MPIDRNSKAVSHLVMNDAASTPYCHFHLPTFNSVQ